MQTPPSIDNNLESGYKNSRYKVDIYAVNSEPKFVQGVFTDAGVTDTPLFFSVPEQNESQAVQPLLLKAQFLLII